MEMLFIFVTWLVGHVDVIQVIAWASVFVNNTYKFGRRVWLDLRRGRAPGKKN